MRGKWLYNFQFSYLSFTFKGKFHVICMFGVGVFLLILLYRENHVALFPDLTLQHLGAVKGFLIFCTAEVKNT